MNDTDLKHLTLKSVFLLVLASSKQRSEIHTLFANSVQLEQVEKVPLLPFSDFISKNHLASEDSQSVTAALTTIVNR